ncbi:MAG: hypothetical protein ACYC7D_04890 [Nitrososphaerales archaeon]
MKRSKQLILESSIVAVLIIGITLGGTMSTLSLPASWLTFPDPATIATQYDLNGLALYYNSTLSGLASENFSGVSTLLNSSTFLSYPAVLSAAVSSAGIELTSVNVSVPLAISGFNLTNTMITKGELQNASSSLGSACSEVQSANDSFSQFEGPTSATFLSNAVPVSNYSLGARSLNLLLSSLFAQCHALQIALASFSGSTSTNNGHTLIVNFTISSGQSSILTGGFVQVGGRLTLNSTGLANDLISFYLNGTEFATTATGNDGSFSINESIPFVYVPVGKIWAVASKDQANGFAGAVSNSLYFAISFNETQIIVTGP